MPATREDFTRALAGVFTEAERLDVSFIGLTAGALHRRVGGYPGDDHRMPACCRAMREAMSEGDAIIHQPPRGDGASLLIRYSIPRPRKST